jgi:dihydrofolate synthase/folylpolyglutamate synthase
MSYQETLQYLDRLLRWGMKLGLENIRRLLEHMASPQNEVPAIHVGGSNGKGSVAAFLSSILAGAGYRVGLTTSPHLIHVEERIVVDGDPISQEAFAAAATHVREHVEALQASGGLDGSPTYYEFLIATAFHVFQREKCDLQIVEVGMGGRLDATNVLEKPLLSVITRIDVEHSRHLGETPEEIAVEKAGIARPGVPVVTFERRPATLEALRAAVREKGATLVDAARECRAETGADGNVTFYIGKATYRDLAVPLPGEHQIENLALALRAVEALRSRGLAITREQVELGVESTRWPGRLEVVRTHPTLLLDGAHNPAGARALAAYLDTLPEGGKLLLVFGAMKDKDLPGIMEPLFPRAARIFLTRALVPRSESPEGLLEEAREFHDRLETFAAPGEALDAALSLAEPRDTVLVAGSLILVGDVKQHLAASP